MKTGLLFRLVLVLLLVAVFGFGATTSMTSGANGAKISAHLTKTSFTASQVGSVKLVYRFSRPSRRFSYVLTFATGSRWQPVKSVKKKGRFKGSYTTTVAKLFAGKPVKVGRYRLKVSADVGSRLVAFTVVNATSGSPPGAFNKTSPANGATGQPSSLSLSWGTSSNAARYEYCIDTTNNNACDGSWVSTNSATSAGLSGLSPGATYYWQVRAINAHGTTNADGGSWASFTVSGVSAPRAGSWASTSLSGPVSGCGPVGCVTVKRINFEVGSDQATVSKFFVYYEDCEGPDSSWLKTASPISNGQFSTPSPSGHWTDSGGGFFNGTFDSPTSAHGTAEFSASISGFVCVGSGSASTGKFSWTAQSTG